MGIVSKIEIVLNTLYTFKNLRICKKFSCRFDKCKCNHPMFCFSYGDTGMSGFLKHRFSYCVLFFVASLYYFAACTDLDSEIKSE